MRRRSNANQADWATMIGRSLRWVKQVELGRIDVLANPEFKTILPHEKCFIYRRRCGKTQAEVARGLGLSRLWVNKMERGLTDCTPLACYWES